MTREAYTYMVLRYRHDPVAGEQVNVGVALHAPESRFLGAAIRTAYGRVAKVFPSVDGKGLKRDLAAIDSAFAKLAKTDVGTDLVEKRNVSTFARMVLPDDDSSLVWSEMGSGLTSDPARTLNDLHDRFVTQNDEAGAAGKRNDADVWKPFRDLLLERAVADVFQEKTIATDYDEVDFAHAWKNGKWHCFQPLSFDLASQEGIQDKAARWVGHMVGLKGAADSFKLYFVVGRPSDEALLPAFDRALEFIESAPLDPVVVTERDFAKVADDIADKVHAHRSATGK